MPASLVKPSLGRGLAAQGLDGLNGQRRQQEPQQRVADTDKNESYERCYGGPLKERADFLFHV
jgi:hypothetical protein